MCTEDNPWAHYTHSYTLSPRPSVSIPGHLPPRARDHLPIDAPSRKILVRRNNASPGWITSTSRRLAVAVMVAATVAAADVVAIAVAAALAAQRNMNGNSLVR